MSDRGPPTCIWTLLAVHQRAYLQRQFDARPRRAQEHEIYSPQRRFQAACRSRRAILRRKAKAGSLATARPSRKKPPTSFHRFRVGVDAAKPRSSPLRNFTLSAQPRNSPTRRRSGQAPRRSEPPNARHEKSLRRCASAKTKVSALDLQIKQHDGKSAKLIPTKHGFAKI